MADFCWQCTENILGLDGEVNDFKGLSTKDDTNVGTYAVVLCEGCGQTLVDHTGRCVYDKCIYKHGLSYTESTLNFNKQ